MQNNVKQPNSKAQWGIPAINGLTKPECLYFVLLGAVLSVWSV
jgi:hypothetical protein